MDENFNDILYEAIRRQNRKTNADRIRAMSDEELAEAFAMQCAGRVCKGIPFDGKNECVKCWLDWLQQEETND